MNAPDTHLQANTRLLRMPQVLERVGLKDGRLRPDQGRHLPEAGQARQRLGLA